MKVLFLLQNMYADESGISPLCFKPNENNKSAKTCRKIIGSHHQLLFSNCSPVKTNRADSNPGRDLEHTDRLMRAFQHYDLLIVCGKEAQKAYRECEEKFNGLIWFMPHPASRNLTNVLVNEIKQRFDHYVNTNHNYGNLNFKQYSHYEYSITTILNIKTVFVDFKEDNYR